ncbi:MAG: hypothetical protein Q9181_008032, partial [Wetmoreana brouardii]
MSGIQESQVQRLLPTHSKAEDPDAHQDPTLSEGLKSEDQATKNGNLKPQNQETARHSMQKSSMRSFLDSNAKFEWPPDVGQRRGSHCILPINGSIPFHCVRRVSDKVSGLDEYRAGPRFNFNYDFVVKAVSRISRSTARATAREVHAMKSLRHPHCMAFLGTFEYQGWLSIMIYPVAICDLQQVIKITSRDVRSRRALDIATNIGDFDSESGQSLIQSLRGSKRLFDLEERINILRRCFVCLSQGLEYLHKSKVRLENIKPSNILVDRLGSVILADFGLKSSFPNTSYGWTVGDEPQLKAPSRPILALHATSHDWGYTNKYASPEITRGKSVPRSDRSDVFSLGCVLLEAATLVLGQDLQSIVDTYREHRLIKGRTVVDYAYCRNLERIYVWIENLRSPDSGKGLDMSGASRKAQPAMVNALSDIRLMLDERPENRPPAYGLWERFKTVSLELCADCDPRHPNVWKPQVRSIDSLDSMSEESQDTGSSVPSHRIVADPGTSSLNFKQASLDSGEPQATGGLEGTFENRESDAKPGDLPAIGGFEQLDTTESHIPANLAGKSYDYVINEAKVDDNTASLPSFTHSSSLSSSDSIEVLLGAAEELASLFLKDEVLTPLYEKALARVDTIRFERNFARLIDIFGKNLQAEAKNPLELSAVQLVKARSKYIAICMGQHLDPGRMAESQKMHQLITESLKREQRMEFLQRQVFSTDTSESLAIHESTNPEFLAPKSDSNAEDSEPERPEQPQLRNLKEVKGFIIASSAMVKLREDFHRFVFQGEKTSREPLPYPDPLNINPEQLRDPVEEPLEPSDSDSVESVEYDTQTTKISVQEEASSPLLRLTRRALRCFATVAEFFELSEPPLQPGFRRLRWT